MHDDKSTDNQMHDDKAISQNRWLRETVDNHAAPLLRYARSLTNNGERAKDAVQETFLRLCKAKREDLESRIPPWLYCICRSRVIDMARKEGVMTALDDYGTANLEVQSPPPDRQSETRDSASQAIELLKGLPGKQREVVRLKFQNDMSYKEIAEITELSVSNVGFLLHTALKTLRAEMQS